MQSSRIEVECMPPIETITRPHRNRISVSVPKEYSAYSFQVILVPLGVDAERRVSSRPRRDVEGFHLPHHALHL